MDRSNILVINNDQVTLKWMVGFLSNSGFEVRFASYGLDGLKILSAMQPDLVILDSNLPDMSSEQMVDSIIQNPITANIPVVILFSNDNPSEADHLFDKGMADYIIKMPGFEAKLLSICSACLKRAKHTTSNLMKGRMISFFSAKGGNGTSTLCLNLAHRLARQVRPKKVLVTDMVLPLGSLGIVTGSQQVGSIAKLTTIGEPYDYAKINKFLSSAEKWGFSILQGSYNPHDAQTLKTDQIETLYKALQLVFNYVIVDLGKTLSCISLPILQSSDRVVIILSQDLVAIELTQIALKFLQEIGIHNEKIILILNRAVGHEGLSKLEIENRFGLPIQGTVPFVRDDFTISSNQNIPYGVRFPEDTTSLVLDALAELLHK